LSDYLSRLVRRELWKGRLRLRARRYRATWRIKLLRARRDGATWIGDVPHVDVYRVAMRHNVGSYEQFMREASMSLTERVYARLRMKDFRVITFAYREPGCDPVRWASWEPSP
jgi:hypothetical protein